MTRRARRRRPTFIYDQQIWRRFGLRRELLVILGTPVIGAVIAFLAISESGRSPVATSLVPSPSVPARSTSAPMVVHPLEPSPDPLAAGSAVALGVNVSAPDAAGLASFSAMTGARPRLVMWSQSWDEPLFYGSQIRPVAALGALPMISWDPIVGGVGIPLSQIAAGRYDPYIRKAGAEARRWGGRIYVRFAHEMNLPGSPFGPGHDGNTPSEYIAAWRHVTSVFTTAGATNVEWVWSPNVDCNGACPFTTFYPGDQWVNWVALDGYNYSVVNGDAWMSFAQIFGPSYETLTHLSGKPLMIAETASAEEGGSKAQWMTDMGHALSDRFTRVRALVWFQRVKETDWRINSSLASLEAFRSLVRSAPFSGPGGSTGQ